MALAYREPSVTIEEVVSPNIAPLLASPANVCVVGRSIGHQVSIDQIRLTDTAASPTNVSLPGLPSGGVVQGVVSVKDSLDPSKGTASDNGGYVLTQDYTVDLTTGTISRVTGGDIGVNTIVDVTYNYLPESYFTATRLSDFSAVEARYGDSYSADGNSINSPLSYAAQLAFENGAAEVICQPLFERSTPGNSTSVRRQPSGDASFASVTSWRDTLYALRDIEDINIVVPVVGQSEASVSDASQLSIFKTFQDHIQYMRTNDQYIVGLFAEDSSTDSTKATQTTLKEHAGELAGRYNGAVSQHITFIEPSRFARISSITGLVQVVGGQYVAAAIAGMIAARPVSSPLTRKQVSGFSGVLVTRLKNEKNELAQLGLTVVEQRGAAVQVRHAITLDNSNTATRELSVVRAKHRMIESVRDTLETQVIGNVIADDSAPLVVRGAVIAVLERLVGNRDIVGYRNVTARTLSIDPTTIEVRFSYAPAFPVNYVNIKFSLDLTGPDGITSLGQ